MKTKYICKLCREEFWTKSLANRHTHNKHFEHVFRVKMYNDDGRDYS